LKGWPVIFDYFKKIQSLNNPIKNTEDEVQIVSRNSNTDDNQYNTTKWKKPTKRSKAIDIMKANADLAMDEVLPLIAAAINGSITEAKAHYKWLCENNYAPGNLSGNKRLKAKNSLNNKNHDKSLVDIANDWLAKKNLGRLTTDDENSLMAVINVMSSGDTEITVHLSVDQNISIVSFIMTPRIYIDENNIQSARSFIEEHNPSYGMLEIRDDGLVFYVHSRCFEGVKVGVSDVDDMYSQMLSFVDKFLPDLEKYTASDKNLDQLDLTRNETPKSINTGELSMSADREAALNNSLVKFFERMMITYKIDDDGDYYISEGLAFPGWVSVIQNGSFIKIWTWIKFRDGENVDEEAANRLVNNINLRYLPNSVFQGNGSLHSQYYYPADAEFDDKQFNGILRRCFESFVASVRECDDEDLVP
jgi:hypothetical protein